MYQPTIFFFGNHDSHDQKKKKEKEKQQKNEKKIHNNKISKKKGILIFIFPEIYTVKASHKFINSPSFAGGDCCQILYHARKKIWGSQRKTN